MLNSNVCRLDQSKKLYELGVRWRALYGYVDGDIRKQPFLYEYDAYDSVELEQITLSYFTWSEYKEYSVWRRTGYWELYKGNKSIGSFNKWAEAEADLLIKMLEELKGKQTLKQA